MQVTSQYIRSRGKIFIIKIGGCLDIVTTKALEKAVDDMVDARNYRLIVDLGDVDYICSMAWSVFLSNLKFLREHGGDIKLVNMKTRVYEVFKILEFYWFLKSFSTIEQAILDFELERQPAPEQTAQVY